MCNGVESEHEACAESSCLCPAWYQYIVSFSLSMTVQVWNSADCAFRPAIVSIFRGFYLERLLFNIQDFTCELYLLPTFSSNQEG